MGKEEDDLEETTGGGFKRPEPGEPKKNGKVKKFFKKTGEGAKAAGGFVSKKVGESIAAAKEARTPEAKREKLEARKELLQAKKELLKEKQDIATTRASIATQRATLRKTQLKSAGINAPKFVRGTQELGVFASGGKGAGLGSFDAGNVLGGGSNNGGIDFGGNLTSAFGLIGGTNQPSRAATGFKTVKTKRRVRIKRGKKKGKFRTTTTKRRVAVKGQAPAQPKAFDPFSQI